MKLCRGAIPIALLLLLGSGTDALADFRICNKSVVQVDVSFGWNDASSGWTSQGWWNLPIGSCATVWRGDLTNGVYYLYATGENGRLWGASDSDGGGAFCISKAKYVAHNRDYRVGKDTINCEAAGLEGKRFRRVDTGSYKDFTYNLTSRADDPLRVQPVTSSAPPPVVTPPSTRPPQGGTACQRYPNLC